MKTKSGLEPYGKRAHGQQIEIIKSAAVFVGESGLGPWQNHEIPALLSQFVKREFPVIPVILPSAKTKAGPALDAGESPPIVCAHVDSPPPNADKYSLLVAGVGIAYEGESELEGRRQSSLFTAESKTTGSSSSGDSVSLFQAKVTIIAAS
jgi:hypothetical protein